MATNALHCKICPGLPSFSDQSHLLTHIISKGHLSHYFKAQVRSHQDPKICAALKEYDKWYRESKIEELLALRLRNKDAKAVGRQDARAYQVDSHASGNEKTFDRSEHHTSAATDTESSFPPRLQPLEASHAGYQGAMKRSGTFSGFSQAPLAPMAGNTGLMGRRVTDDGQFRTGHVLSSSSSPMGSNLLGTTVTATPFMGQAKPFYSSTSLPELQPHKAATPSLASGPGDKVDESLRLKGIIWPGMDLFDTANEDSKRKRNQKKAAGTLHQMQVESELIEPTERIYYYPSWGLKKARFISGEVESSPPPEVVSEPKLRRSNRKRAALSELDPNISSKVKFSRQSREGDIKRHTKNSHRAAKVERNKKNTSRFAAVSGRTSDAAAQFVSVNLSSLGQEIPFQSSARFANPFHAFEVTIGNPFNPKSTDRFLFHSTVKHQASILPSTRNITLESSSRASPSFSGPDQSHTVCPGNSGGNVHGMMPTIQALPYHGANAHLGFSSRHLYGQPSPEHNDNLPNDPDPTDAENVTFPSFLSLLDLEH